MSLQITDKNTVPPGGFRYKVPETGVKIASPSWDDLRIDTRKHYRANNLAIPLDLDVVMQEYMCAELPSGFCQHDIHPTRGIEGGVTFAQVMQGTATLWDWFLHGRQKVEPEEALRRTRICASCPNNRDPQGCTACNNSALHGVVERIVGASRTGEESFLKACSICGCALKAKVWFPLDILQRNTPENVRNAYPDFCWNRA